ncbi:MAG: DUF4175 family protein [bacterium]
MTESGRRLRDAARRFGRHETRRRIAAAALRGAAGSLVILAALALADRFVPLDQATTQWPAALAALGFACALALPVAAALRAWWRRRPAIRDLEESARRTEAQSEALRERLVPALQVLRTRSDARTGYSDALVDAFVDVAAKDVEAVRPETFPYNATLRRSARDAGLALALMGAVFVVLGPVRAGHALVDVATALARIAPRSRPEFAVRPGDVSVPRGTSVRLAADVRHAVVVRGRATGAFEWRADENASWQTVELRGGAAAGDDKAPAARFEHEFRDVHESFHYRFRHAGATSKEFAVKAVTAPSLAIEEVRYRYPAYTGLEERVVKDGSGDLAAVRGTVARVLARSTNDARTGTVRFGDGTERRLEVDPDGRVRADVELAKDGTYTMRVEDVLGLVNPDPLEYRIRALPDEAPFIRLLAPGEDRDIDEGMKVDLRFSALDDYGLGPVTLVWRVSRRPGKTDQAVLATPQGIRTELEDHWEWDLAKLDLLPGDTVTYHLEVRDNNTMDGPSTGRTRDYTLRFPTLGEVFAQIDEHHETSIEDLGKVVDEAKKVETKIGDVSREMLKRGESSWENKQEMERALQAQEALGEKLRATREQIEQNMQQLSQSQLATLDAVEKMDKIRELLDQVATQEMKDALEKLRKALEEAEPQHQQQDLADFKEAQDELMKQLDRVLENLKQFRLDERLKAAVRRTEELAARQERVNDRLDAKGKDTPPDENGEKQGEDRQGKDSQAKDSQAKDSQQAKNDSTQVKDDSTQGKDADGKDVKGEDEKGKDAAKDEKASDGLAKDDESADGKKDAKDEKKDLGRMAGEEKSLANETRDLEKEIKEIAEATKELRERRDADTMSRLSDKMHDAQIPQKMDGMSKSLQSGDQGQASEQGEKALTELESLLSQLSDAQSGMQMHVIQVSQAAINRAVRDLLSLSTDQESLSGDLAGIPGNSSSATREFADEQQLLLRGGERVRNMLQEVAKDTPLMDSKVGRGLDAGLRSMHDVADGLETGAVHTARDQSGDAVEQLNGVVITLLETAKSMSSCSSGMPMSSLMQQLQEMSGNQQKLNDALKQLREQGGGDHRLQAQLQRLGEQQRQLQEQLQQLLDQTGQGKGLLGRLDEVSKKLDEVAKQLAQGKVDDQTMRDQEWALTRLLDSQRSMRERDLGRQRSSRPGEDLSGAPPAPLAGGTEKTDRDLREDLLKALERRYPPKYEDLIRRYFRELSREAPNPDLP